MLARFRFVWLLFVGFPLVAATARAEPIPPERIPDVLKPWVPWVLDDLGDDVCPQVNEVRTCVWPSALALSVNAKGGTFTLRVTTERKRSVVLPGSQEHWPEDVRVDGKPIAVLEPQGVPEVILDKGSHVVTGRFSWPELPDSLVAPKNLGTLSLTVDGTQVAFPRREASGLVWLHKGLGREGDADRLELTVHRKLTDGVPLVVVTRIQVSAAGKAREVVLPSVLVPGTRPIQLVADLPAQLEPNGTLRMQAQGGDYRIELTAIREAPADTLSAPKPGAPWPEHEIWVWSGDERLRHVELSGVAQIDPARTDLANDWRGLQTYVVPQGQALTFTTRRRGEPEPPPNHLTLNRTLWLDLDGDGYTVRDQLTGTLSRSFRIDLLEGELGHAVVDGVDLLITNHEQKPGIELRTSALNLNTEWRLEKGRSSLPAVGYSEDVQSLSAELKLPPGYLLLGASGVDRVPGTWLDQWDLFDFFFVLVVSLSVAKLAGRTFGFVALATLVLTHHESEAPAMAWVFLLVCTAVLRVVKPGARFEKVARGAYGLAFVTLLLVLVPFAVDQVREALYPHLKHTYAGDTLVMRELAVQREAAEPEAAPEAPMQESEEEALGYEAASSRVAPMKRKSSADEDAAYGGVQKNVYARTELDANAVVQTGPGVPTWSFQSFPLIWSGPVEKGQRIDLYMAPPALTRLWSLLNVLLSGVLLFALARAAHKKAGLWLSEPPPPPGTAALLLCALTLSTSTASAQAVPPDDVLQRLRERLTAPAACEPRCLSVERLDLTIEGSRLTLRATVHAGGVVGYRAPGPLESWAPASVRVDGKDALSLTRLDDGFLHVRLEPGLHTVELSGPVSGNQALTLALGSAPHRVNAKADGWVIEGLRADGRAEGSLVLRREVVVEDQSERVSQALAQWVEVRREFDLGVRFRVRTTITRLGPASESLLLRLPLLPGESVLGNGLTSDGKTVTVELGRDVPSMTLNSTLSVTKRIDLRAAVPSERAEGPVLSPWNERWVVRCSALYHCDFEGLAPVSRAGEDGVSAFTYRPWPGETLTIHAQRLEAEKGAAVTIDRATLALTPGARMEQAKLTLEVRTSRGTTERVKLPEDTSLRALTVNGTARPARIADGTLEVSLDPGSHTIVLDLQAPRGMGFKYESGKLSVSRPLVNVQSSVEVPRDRWLLFAYGPDWGPAVLFWGYLVVVVLAALALSRVPKNPLKPHEWLLLGLGLTQTEVPVVLIVVGWLFLLAFRARITKEDMPGALFNLMQVGIAVATVIALVCLAFAVHGGLVVQPDMQVEGMGSTNTHLAWYVDRTAGEIPTVGIISLPLWTYKALMLAWALWLAFSLIRWLRLGFSAFRHGGVWTARKPSPPKPENPRVPPEQIAAAQAALEAQRAGTSPSRSDES